MKRHLKDFVCRGMVSFGFGPVVLAVFYMILHKQGRLDSLTVDEVCVGIFSLGALSFVAGGMNCIYQIERLPLMTAILIHGSVLYISYLITYLVNGWLDRGLTPVLVFTGIFVVGYLTIWAAIYSVIKKNTEKLNEMLKKRQGEGS